MKVGHSVVKEVSYGLYPCEESVGGIADMEDPGPVSSRD